MKYMEESCSWTAYIQLQQVLKGVGFGLTRMLIIFQLTMGQVTPEKLASGGERREGKRGREKYEVGQGSGSTTVLLSLSKDRN